MVAPVSEFLPLQPTRFFQFSGGLNTHDSAFAVPPTQLIESWNWIDDPSPAISKRPGYIRAHDTQIICVEVTSTFGNPVSGGEKVPEAGSGTNPPTGSEGTLSIHAWAGIHEYETLDGTERDILAFHGNGPIYLLNMTARTMTTAPGVYNVGPITDAVLGAVPEAHVLIVDDEKFIRDILADFLGTVGESFIIDTDHWRHFWMMLGCLWGMFAAAQRYQAPAERQLAADQVHFVAP